MAREPKKTNPDKPINPDGTVTISIGDLLKEVDKIAEQEKRSTSKQVAVIVREWLEARKQRARNTQQFTAS